MTTETATSVGDRVREARQQRGWTLSDLARESGVSRSYLWQIEQNGSSPTLDKALCLARALGVPLEYLAGVDREHGDWWRLWHQRQGRNHLFEASNHLHKAKDRRAVEVAALLRSLEQDLG